MNKLVWIVVMCRRLWRKEIYFTLLFTHNLQFWDLWRCEWPLYYDSSFQRL